MYDYIDASTALSPALCPFPRPVCVSATRGFFCHSGLASVARKRQRIEAPSAVPGASTTLHGGSCTPCTVLPAAVHSPGTVASETAAQDPVWAVLEGVAAAVARAPPSAGPSVPPPPPQPQLPTLETGTPSLVRSQASESEAGPIGIPPCDLTFASPSTFRGATSVAELQAQLRAWDLDNRYMAIGVSTVQCKSCAAALPAGTRTSGTAACLSPSRRLLFPMEPCVRGAAVSASTSSIHCRSKGDWLAVT
jgi:hypothetical protein